MTRLVSNRNAMTVRQNSKDWTGQKIGLLTFVAPSGKTKDSRVIWEAKCDCGNTIHIEPKYVNSGNTTSCGCKRRTYTPMLSSARTIWHRDYKDIDFLTFLSLSQQSCYWCGIAPHRVYNVYTSTKKSKVRCYQSEDQRLNGNFTYNGLDRLDSNLGHSTTNVVPCCSECNWMKQESSVEEFKSYVKRIHDHMKLSESDVFDEGRRIELSTQQLSFQF
jgi:hypothetical protein